VTPARRLAGTVLALLLASVALWLAGAAVWLRASYRGPLRGSIAVSATGAELKPHLGALALLALALVAALVASAGRLRRVLGVVAAGVAAWVLYTGVEWYLGPVSGALDGTAHPPPAEAVAVGQPARTGAAVLVIVAGLLLLVAAVGMIRWAAVMPGMGSRYTAPAAARRSPDGDGDWWQALDAGDDPTTGGSGGRLSTDPGPSA
jgi:uncharacterized membrane protein (TIGR02234 family)